VILAHTWLDGLSAGFNKATGEATTGTDMYYLNAMMDFESLMEKWAPEEYAAITDKRTRTHCSGFVYPQSDFQDIFISHVSWTSWSMGFNRITKVIDL